MAGKRARTADGGVRAGLVVLGCIVTAAMWQLVLLGQKPDWMFFGAGKFLNLVLFPAPLVAAYFLSRLAGRKAWLQGGLMLGIGYLLTVPYNVMAENTKVPGGFVRYWGGSFATAVGGVVTFFAIFFAIGAAIGYLAGRASAKRGPAGVRVSAQTKASQAGQPSQSPQAGPPAQPTESAQAGSATQTVQPDATGQTTAAAQTESSRQ